MDTGKTTAIKQYLDDNYSDEYEGIINRNIPILAITHRQSLSENLSKRFRALPTKSQSIANGLDSQGATFCIDSLYENNLLKLKVPDYRNSIIFIDEIHQLFKDINS